MNLKTKIINAALLITAATGLTPSLMAKQSTDLPIASPLGASIHGHGLYYIEMDIQATLEELAPLLRLPTPKQLEGELKRGANTAYAKKIVRICSEVRTAEKALADLVDTIHRNEPHRESTDLGSRMGFDAVLRHLTVYSNRPLTEFCDLNRYKDHVEGLARHIMVDLHPRVLMIARLTLELQDELRPMDKKWRNIVIKEFILKSGNIPSSTREALNEKVFRPLK